MDNEIVPVGGEVKFDLALARAPKQVLAEAQEAAKALQSVIAQSPTVVKFNGKSYLSFEHWQTCGRFYGVTAKVVSTEPVEMDGVKGFISRAEAINTQTGQVISAAESMCMNDEPNWSKKPLFQLRSMAQTRSCAKALRNVLAWVVVLAGYEASVAEEMVGNETPAKPDIQEPKRKSEAVPVPADVETAEFVPADYNVKTAPDGKWTKHGVKSPDGRWFGTFDEKTGELLAQATEQKKAVKIAYTSDGKYNTVKKAVLA